MLSESGFSGRFLSLFSLRTSHMDALRKGVVAIRREHGNLTRIIPGSSQPPSSNLRGTQNCMPSNYLSLVYSSYKAPVYNHLSLHFTIFSGITPKLTSPSRSSDPSFRFTSHEAQSKRELPLHVIPSATTPSSLLQSAGSRTCILIWSLLITGGAERVLSCGLTVFVRYLRN
jgi:hypothetical protein